MGSELEVDERGLIAHEEVGADEDGKIENPSHGAIGKERAVRDLEGMFLLSLHPFDEQDDAAVDERCVAVFRERAVKLTEHAADVAPSLSDVLGAEDNPSDDHETESRQHLQRLLP